MTEDLERRIHELDRELAESEDAAWDDAKLWDAQWQKEELRSQLVRELCARQGREYAAPVTDDAVPWHYEAPSVQVSASVGCFQLSFRIDEKWRKKHGVEFERGYVRFDRAVYFCYDCLSEDDWPKHRLWDYGMQRHHLVYVMNSTVIAQRSIPSHFHHVLVLFKDYSVDCCAESFEWGVIENSD